MPHKPPTFRPKHAQQAVKAYEQQRPSACKRGYGRAWQRYVNAFWTYPENLFCACGCKRLGQQVDHIIPCDQDDPAFFNPLNHQPMTADCHKIKTNRFDGGGGREPDISPAGLAELERMKAKARERVAAIRARCPWY